MICLYADVFNSNDEFVFDRPTEDIFIFVYNGEIVAKDKNVDSLKHFRNMHIIGESIKDLTKHDIPLLCTDLLSFVCGTDAQDDMARLENIKRKEIAKCKIFIELDINKSKKVSEYFTKIKQAIKDKRDSNRDVRVFSYESILKNDIIKKDFLELCKELHDTEANDIC